MVSYSFGPNVEDPRNPALCLVYRRGSASKERFDTDQIVGTYRHTNYLYCPHFVTVAHVINDIISDPDLNFYPTDKKKLLSGGINHYSIFLLIVSNLL